MNGSCYLLRLIIWLESVSMPISRGQTVYFLPGQGGRLDAGLGQGLMSRGLDVAGRETRGEFRHLSFSSQVQIIADDLAVHF